MAKEIHILAISGSLRTGSSNHAVIRAAAGMLPAGVTLTQYHGLGDLPHFNDAAEAAAEVIALRRLVSDADGILISTPEYAFGVPGVMKNALDWTVTAGSFVNKPTAVITAATGGDKAHASILLTLGALSANVAGGHTLLIQFVRSKMKEDAIADLATLQAIQQVINALMQTIQMAREAE